MNNELLTLTIRICELNSEYYDNEPANPVTMNDMTTCMKRVLELVPADLDNYAFVATCRSVAIEGYYSDSIFDEIDNESWDFLIAVALHNANTLSDCWVPEISFDRHLAVLATLKARSNEYDT